MSAGRSGLVVAAVLVWSAPAAADEPVRSYLGPAGTLAAGRHALFVSADNELAGYPAVEAGWRYGIGGIADVGLEVQAIDVAVLGRLHGKVQLYQSDGGRGFVGLRLRADFKRHEQLDVSQEVFRPIDDFGPVLAPELSSAWRLGDAREHALYYATYVYLDFDVRPEARRLDVYYAPLMLGYEWRHASGFHLLGDGAAGFELGRADTVGELILRGRIRIGLEL